MQPVCQSVSFVDSKIMRTEVYYLSGVSKARQFKIPPFLLANHTFPAGFPLLCMIRYKDCFRPRPVRFAVNSNDMIVMISPKIS